MKRFLTILSAAAVVLAVSSCRKHEQPQEEVEQHDFTEFTEGGAYYFGVYNGTAGDFNMFCTYLLAGQTRVDDRVISGVGTALWLDMNVEINDDNTIPTAVFGPARDESATINAFLKGSDNPNDTDIPAGSYIYYHPLSGAAVYKRISAGQVTFTNLDNGKYKITAQVTADGEKYTFDFYDFFSYTDVVPQPDPTPDPDPSTDSDWTHAQVENLGTLELGDWTSQLPTNYCDWKLMIGDKDFDFNNISSSTGDEMEFELITSDTATDITGTYTVKTAELNTLEQYQSSLVAGSALCGYFETVDDQNNYYGTWYYQGTDASNWLGATDGSVTITKSGSNYTVKWDFTDGFNDDKEFSGTYTGTIPQVGTKSCVRRNAPAGKSKARVHTSVDRIAVTAAK